MKTFVAVCIILQCFMFGLGQGVCPLGFGFPYQSSCYKLFDDLANWVQASKVCRAHNGSNLISIESRGEHQHIVNTIRAQIRSPIIVKDRNWGFWTSGSDANKEGSWIWTGTGRGFSYRNWGWREPNNKYSDITGFAENCMHLSSGVNWAWNDMQSYICEKSET